MYCVAIDPGQTTGIAYVRDEQHPWHIEFRQLGPEEHHADLASQLRYWAPSIVVCESFENRANEAALIISAEYIGVVKAYGQEYGRPVVWQSAATGKAFWTDDKLRKHNLFARGMKHARDACRHYLYYRTFTLKDQSLLQGGRSLYVGEDQKAQ